MNFSVLVTRSKFLLNQNSSIILTGVGVAGTVATAILTGRASYKSAGMISHAKTELLRDVAHGNGGMNITEDDTFSIVIPKYDVVKLTWKNYIIPVGVGAITVSAIIISHRVDAKKIVALTVASGVSERALKEYKERVLENIGPRQEGKLRDEIAQNRVTNSYDNYGEHYPVRKGKILCMELLTGRYFDSTPEEMQRAINAVNSEMLKHDGVPLSRFFDEVGLAPSAYSDEVGWNPIELVNLSTSAAMTPDQRPCLVVDFIPRPFPNFEDLH